MTDDIRAADALGLGSEEENRAGGATRRPGRKPYGPPRLISSEPLEFAAGTCSPPTGPFGKTYVPPSTCTQLGS
ncbi:MAG: hypothetical protein HRF46_10865 [Acidobacteriota bacterium]|jgi:hypothetical protein